MPSYKPIRFKLEDWETIKTLADELSLERGTEIRNPPAVMEAVKFFQEHRNSPYIRNYVKKG